MKLIDIMKRYNKCILKENAKLRSIYNTLIRECDGTDTENECDVSECDGTDTENECDANEAEGTKMSIAEFLGECEKEDGKKETADECDACGDDDCKDGEKCGLKEEDEDETNEDEQIDEVSDDDLMTAEKFFAGTKKGGKKGGKKETADECDACGDDDCKDGEKCGLKEEDEDETNEDEQLISKDEFYAANEDEEIEEEEEETNEDEEIEEDEEETNEDEENDVSESKKDDEKELSESLEKHYRAANRKLFNV